MYSSSLRLSKALRSRVPNGGGLGFNGVSAGASGAIILDLNVDYKAFC